MKYLILMAEHDHFTRWADAEESERERVYDDFRAFSKAVADRGRIVAGEALVRPEEASTVRPGGSVTDGPYAETAEQLGGFYLIDVPTKEDAVELAGLLPDLYLREVRGIYEVDVD